MRALDKLAPVRPTPNLTQVKGGKISFSRVARLRSCRNQLDHLRRPESPPTAAGENASRERALTARDSKKEKSKRILAQ